MLLYIDEKELNRKPKIIRVNEEQLKSLKNINENSLHLLNEGTSDIVYHFTTFNGIIGMLTPPYRIALTLSSNKSDTNKSTKHHFYLSMSRTKNVLDSYGYSKDARITLNGRLLRERFKIKQFDYWGAKSLTDIKGQFEYEDRLIYNKPYIENSLDYIERVDVRYRKGDEEYISRVKELCEKFNISFCIYSNKNDFSFQRNDITKNFETVETNIDGEDKFIKSKIFNKINCLALLISILCYDELCHHAYDDDNNEIINIISPCLDKFGLSHLLDKALPTIKEKMKNQNLLKLISDVCAGYDNVGKVRFLNSKDNDGTDDGGKIMLLASYILKKHHATSYSDLFSKISEEENKVETQDNVKCVWEYYNDKAQGNIIDGEERCFWNVISKEIFFDEMNRIIEANEYWNETGNYDDGSDMGLLYHNSKDYNSFRKYVQHLMHNDNLSLYDGANFIWKVSGGGKNACKNSLFLIGEVFQPIVIKKENFDNFKVYMSYSSEESIINKLYGNQMNYWNSLHN